MKISQKLVILLLLIALVPLGIIGIFAYTSIQSALDQQIKVQISNTLTRQANEINNLITKDLRLIDLFTVNTQVRFLMAKYYEDQFETTQQELNDLLGEIRQDNRSFRRIHVLSPEGIIIGSSDKRFIGKDYNDKEIFKRGVQGVDVSMFFKDIDGVLGHYLVERMILEGKFIGVALIEAQADSYTLLTKDYTDTGKTGETILVGHDDNNQLSYLTPLRFKSNAVLTEYTPSNKTPPLDYQNHPVLLMTKEIPITNWIVGVKIDEEEIYAPVTRLRDLMLIVVSTTAIVVVFLALYLARIFTLPIITLTSKTEKIAQGDLSQRIDIVSSDEIGTLASTFNSMTAKLQELYQDLEQKVREKTSELGQKLQDSERDKAKIDEQRSTLFYTLENLPVGISLAKAPNGEISLINKVGAALLGPMRRLKLSENFIDPYPFFKSDGMPYPYADTPFFVTLHEKKVSMRDDVVAHPLSGVKITLRVTSAPILDEKGEVHSVVTVFEDVTHEKEVDRMKTEFISLASHQLRTPLSAIKWFTEMLISGDAGKLTLEQSDFAKNISDSTERMIELVNSLLNISRIESGRIIVDPKPTNLTQLVNGIVNDLKAKTEEKQQTFIVSVHKDLPMISLDPHLIGQVYLNLLTNAIKYTPKGGEISVFVSRKDNELVSQVSDTGYGIPVFQQSRIFQKFFRADNVVKVITDGTGLGLYLIKAIVESSGGRIWFESQEGKGTTFFFSLPITGMIAKKGEVTLGS